MPDHVQLLDVEAMADALLAAYQEAVQAHRVVVVTVESRTGWGKSDAVGRFFSYLREEQDATGYWPADLDGGRHDLYPDRWHPEPGAMLPYLWWGLRGQLEDVNGAMAARPAALDGEWQLQILAAPVAEALDRYDERWRTRLRAALSVSGLVLPLLGDLPRLVEQALMVKDQYDQAQSWREAAGQVRDAVRGNAAEVQRAMAAPDSRDPIRTDRPAQAAQAWRRAAEVLAKVSRVTPVVVAVEDAQLLDEPTVALLRHVQQLDAVGLIVLTIAADRLAPRDYLVEWLSTLTSCPPNRTPAGSEELKRYALSAFTVDELQDIAHDRLADEFGAVPPGAGSGILRLAQAVSGSVLLLHQLLDLPAVSRALTDGQPPPLEDAILRAASADDGRRQAWTTFSSRQRRGLAVASTLGLVSPVEWLGEFLTLIPGCATVAELEPTGWATVVDGDVAIADAATKATLADLRSTELTGDELAMLQGWLGDRIEERHRAETWEELPLRIRLEALRAATNGAPLAERTCGFAVELVELQAGTGQSVPYQRQALQYLLPAASDAGLAATSISVLAGGYLDIDERATAISLLEQHLSTLERDGGSVAEVALCRHELARALQADGQFGAAIEQLERVLAVRLSAEPPDARQLDLVDHPAVRANPHQPSRGARRRHPDTLTSRNNLAGAYQDAGRLNDAIPLYEQTLADRRAVLGPEHPDTLTSRNNLAGAYQSAGRLTEAIPLYEQTLADRERVLGPTTRTP